MSIREADALMVSLEWPLGYAAGIAVFMSAGASRAWSGGGRFAAHTCGNLRRWRISIWKAVRWRPKRPGHKTTRFALRAHKQEYADACTPCCNLLRRFVGWRPRSGRPCTRATSADPGRSAVAEYRDHQPHRAWLLSGS